MKIFGLWSIWCAYLLDCLGKGILISIHSIIMILRSKIKRGPCKCPCVCVCVYVYVCVHVGAEVGGRQANKLVHLTQCKFVIDICIFYLYLCVY